MSKTINNDDKARMLRQTQHIIESMQPKEEQEEEQEDVWAKFLPDHKRAQPSEWAGYWERQGWLYGGH